MQAKKGYKGRNSNKQNESGSVNYSPVLSSCVKRPSTLSKCRLQCSNCADPLTVLVLVLTPNENTDLTEFNQLMIPITRLRPLKKSPKMLRTKEQSSSASCKSSLNDK